MDRTSSNNKLEQALQEIVDKQREILDLFELVLNDSDAKDKLEALCEKCEKVLNEEPKK